MNRVLIPILAVLGALVLWAGGGDSSAGRETAFAPDFPTSEPEFWINSAPLRMSDLRGQVVVLEVWTYGCINCRRSLPWAASIQERFGGKGLTVIGLHAPEFDHERETANVRAQVRKLEVRYPVVIDNEFRMWNALGNRYWPAFYLIDKRGRVRELHVGEVHSGSAKALGIERSIQELLDEAA